MNLKKIQDAQMVLLDIAIDIDSLCRKHNITYWIDGGTTLGAVRNGGFIPWDDDLDICFLVDDFHRVRKAIKEDLIPNNPKYLLYNDHRPFEHYSEYLADTSMLKNKFYPVEIDLISVKSIPNNKQAIQKDKDWVNLLAFFNNLYEKGKIENKSFLYEHLSKGSFLFRKERFQKKFINYINQLNTIKKDHLYWYSFNNVYDTKEKEYYTYNDIFPLQEIKFEGHKFFAPNNIDVYLTKHYGKDYLTPPPKEQQISMSRSLRKSNAPRFISKFLIWFLYLLKAIKNSFTLISKIKKRRIN